MRFQEVFVKCWFSYETIAKKTEVLKNKMEKTIDLLQMLRILEKQIWFVAPEKARMP